MLSNILPVLLPLAVGAVIAGLAYGSGRITLLPALKRVKADYPLINVALQSIAQMTNGTPYDYLFDVVASVYGGTALSNDEAAKLTEAAIQHFNKKKYINTPFNSLDQTTVAKGREIAEKILNAQA